MEGGKQGLFQQGSTIAFLHLEMDLMCWVGFHGEVWKTWSMMSGTEGAQNDINCNFEGLWLKDEAS